MWPTPWKRHWLMDKRRKNSVDIKQTGCRIMKQETQNKPNVLVVIPARGGSKGLPRKNVADLGGKPLIAWTIEAALSASLPTRVVVSTDDDEIADIAQRYGAEVPFRRPAHLSNSSAAISDVLSHARETLLAQGFQADFEVTLYPTHPFRPAGILDQLIAKGLEGYSPVLTYKKIRFPGHSFFRAEGDRIHPLTPPETECHDRYYCGYRSYGLFVGTQQGFSTFPYAHIIDDPIQLIDIDSEKDLELAREVVRRGLHLADSAPAMACGGM